MLNKTSGELSALRRNALIDFCLHAKHDKAGHPFPMNTQSADDLWEWLRSDPLDSDEIETSWVAEAVRPSVSVFLRGMAAPCLIKS